MAKNRAAALREKKNAQVQARKQQAESRMQMDLENEKQRRMQQQAPATVYGGASPEEMAKQQAYGQYMAANPNDPNAYGLVETAKRGLYTPNANAQMANDMIYNNMLQQGPPTQQVAALQPAEMPMDNMAAANSDPNSSLRLKLAQLLGGQ